MPLSSVIEQNFMLMFVELLTSLPHRHNAADCLLAIMERKDDKEERLPLLTAFNNIQLLTSTVAAFTNSQDDYADMNYSFLKKICQLLCVLGTHQLCTLWSPINGATKHPPSNLDFYVTAIIEISRHPRYDWYHSTMCLLIQNHR